MCSRCAVKERHASLNCFTSFPIILWSCVSDAGPISFSLTGLFLFLAGRVKQSAAVLPPARQPQVFACVLGQQGERIPLFSVLIHDKVRTLVGELLDVLCLVCCVLFGVLAAAIVWSLWASRLNENSSLWPFPQHPSMCLHVVMPLMDFCLLILFLRRKFNHLRHRANQRKYAYFGELCLASTGKDKRCAFSLCFLFCVYLNACHLVYMSLIEGHVYLLLVPTCMSWISCLLVECLMESSHHLSF